MKTMLNRIVRILCLIAIALVSTTAAAQRTTRSSSTINDGYGPNIADDVVVQYDPETGSVIVITDEETNKHIEKVISELDKPIPQVLIRVLFLEVTHGDDLDVGMEFMLQDIEKNSSGGVDSEAIVESIFGLAGETSGGFFQLMQDDLELTIRALDEVSELEVLSRPSILTRNNQEAVITVGQEVPFIRNTRVMTDGQQLNTVEYEDIGIILRVTPQIQSNDLVAMEVTPEISTLTGETVAISETVNAPVFAKRSAETGVVVPNGETVVIGGLMEDQETKTVRKIPLLGDIPGLKKLFSREITDKQKTELLIFLTPYIVPEPSQLVRVSANEKADAVLAPTVFSDEQMNRYLGDWTPEEAD